MAPAMSKRDRGAPAGGGGKGGADSDEETPLVAAGKAQSTVVTIEERAPAENDPKHPMWVVIRAWPAAGWGLAAGGGRERQGVAAQRATRIAARATDARAAQQAPLPTWNGSGPSPINPRPSPPCNCTLAHAHGPPVYYTLASGTLLVINKVAIVQLPAPTFVLLCQLAFSAASVLAAHAVGAITIAKATPRQLTAFVPVVITFLGTIYANVKVRC